MIDAPDKALRKELRDLFAPRPSRPAPRAAYNRGPVYRVAHACFPCRKSFKLATDRSGALERVSACPGCGEPLRWMGRNFKAPKRGDLEQWRKVETLWKAGVRFGSARRPDVEPPPERLREVEDYLRRRE